MNKRIKALFCAFACLFIASIFLNQMLDLRKEHKLNDEIVLKDAPPEIVFTTLALGSFRGLMANWLWIRNIKNQEELRFHESYQIAKLITILQPRYTTAVNHLAWNMAYNISVTVESPVERWFWVQRGISLIRDVAMNYNNNDPELYHELGWLFSHKIDKNLDDANRYYKIQWAMEMQKIYGDKADWRAMEELYLNPYIIGNHLEKQGLQGFTKYLLETSDLKQFIINCSREELIDKRILKVISDEQKEILFSYAKTITTKSLEFSTIELSLSQIIDLNTIISSLNEDLNSWQKVERSYRSSSHIPLELKKAIIQASGKNQGLCLSQIDLFLKRRWSELHYKIIPSIVLDIEQEISPDLDWRLPQAHAIYWAWRGKNSGHKEVTIKCERMIVQSLYSAFQAGRLLRYKQRNKSNIDWTNNLALIDVVSRINKDAINKTNNPSSFKTGYGNFLNEAILALYMNGQIKKANRFYKEYRELKGIKKYPKLDQYVSKMFIELYETSDETEALLAIHTLLRRSMLMLIYGEEQYGNSVQYFKMAKTVYDNYKINMKKFSEGRQLPSFKLILKDSREDFKRQYPQFSDKLDQLIKDNNDST